MVSQLEVTPTAKQNLWQAIQTVISGQNQAPPLVPISRQESLPLSFSQERLWFLHQLEPTKAAAYNIALAFRITGSLDYDVLKKSLNEILRRHESLRTSFRWVEGRPVQLIQPSIPFPITVIDLQQFPATHRETKAMQLLGEDLQKSFDLQDVPLIRGTLIQLDAEEHILLLTVHHIAIDAWSKGVLFEELATLYEAFLGGQVSPLPELPVQYADFAVWQREWLQGDFLQTLLDYWKRQLGSNLDELQLPCDHPRPTVPTCRSATQKVKLPKGLSEALKILSRQEKVTLFVTLLAAFKVLLHRYTEQEQLFVCSPTANRTRKETKGLMGYFVNLLILKTDLSGNPSFREFLGRVSQVASGGYAYQELPVQQLLQSFNFQQAPLSQVMFALQNTTIHQLKLPGLTVQNLDIDTGTADFDLYLYLIEEAGTLTAVFKYNTDLFEATTIGQMLQHFQTILENIVASPEQSLSSLLPLTESEQQQLLQKRTKPVHSKSESVYVVPQNALELKLAQLWSEVLNIPSVGVKDNFFDLGGQSLLAMTLFARIEQTFGQTLPLTDLLQAPTVEQLAKLLEQEVKLPAWSSLIPLQPKGHKPPFFCIHGQQGSVFNLRDLANHLGSEQPFYGLQARGLDGKQVPHFRIEDMAAQYIQEIRTIQPKGPYFLGGNSMGGIVAFEMAQQLQQQGQTVAALVMFDTFGRNCFQRLSFRQQNYGKYLGQLGLSRSLWQEINELLQRKRQILMGRFYLSLGRSLPQVSKAWVAEANMQAKRTYIPQIYHGRVILFRAGEPSTFNKFHLPTPDDWLSRDPAHGWSELARDGIEIHDVSGDHFSLFHDPHVQGLAEKLKACLDI